MSSWFNLICLVLLASLQVYSAPWYSIPLKLAANDEHFVTTMSFGSPVAFELDIVMDTGSGSFHIYPNGHNNITKQNIIPHQTNSFQCICQSIRSNVRDAQHATAGLTEFNDNWFQFKHPIRNTTLPSQSINNTAFYIPMLYGCPSWNDTFCDDMGSQCSFSDVTVYYADEQQCEPEGNISHYCTEKVCKAQEGNQYQLLVNTETASFACEQNCYSGIDDISFAHASYTKINTYVRYAYVDRLLLGGSKHDYRNVTLFNAQSWADGTIGLVYNYDYVTSFWQVLGMKPHSALIAFDTMGGRMDVGDVSDTYVDRITYSQNIWWEGTYHYMYLYALSVCNMNLFEVANIGAHYLAMVDTGATCLTLPPELFDVLFTYIPFAFECNPDKNTTFCYVPHGVDVDDVYAFPMLSFKLSMNEDDEDHQKTLYISLKDLVIRLAADKGVRYCIERGTKSIEAITECTPQPVKSGDRVDCTSNGVIIMGAHVFRALYTVVDYPNRRIGLANSMNYTQAMYEMVNERTCNEIQMECMGDDSLNRTRNVCQSGADQCHLYWGWTYDTKTHYCVLRTWIYAAIPLTWLAVMALLLVYLKVKTWIDQHIYYSAIKV